MKYKPVWESSRYEELIEEYLYDADEEEDDE